MDHAIADSHATVTISHSGDQESQDPPKHCNAEIPPRMELSWADGVFPGLLVLFWHEERQEAQGPRKCGPSPLIQKPLSEPTPRQVT
jgi:hypothetical protein